MKAEIFNAEAYRYAQNGVHNLKGAIALLLVDHPNGLKATDIGRALGINGDHIDKGEQNGWLQWTVLKMMEIEGTVEQVKERGPWRLSCGSNHK